MIPQNQTATHTHMYLLHGIITLWDTIIHGQECEQNGNKVLKRV